MEIFYSVYAVLVLAAVLLLYIKGKKKYLPLCEALTKEEYPLKSLTMIGFELMELIKYKYTSPLDRKTRQRMRELKEAEYAEFYLRATWATAATYLMIGLLFSAFMALAGLEVSIVLIAAAFGMLLAYSAFATIDKKVEEYHLEIALELPDFANKLLILSGAGLSLKGAMIKISNDMHRDTPFYEALKHSVFLMENGGTAEEAMDALGERCNMPEVRRLTSALLQNMHSSGPATLMALREISTELWNNRRARAKQIAEKAGTKLLFPMMLMLFAVILIVAAPAIMSLSMSA